MSALIRAIDQAGGQRALAEALGVKQQNVWNWLNRDQRVPAEHCAAIEHATGVSRWELRPEDWWRVWPELIGADGAPDVPPEAKAH